MRICFTLLCFLFFGLKSHAAILSIVTDQSSGRVAKEVEEYLRKAPCFKDLKNLQIKVTLVPKERLDGCQFHALVPRVLNCVSLFSSLSAETNADRLLVIRDSDRFAGGGHPLGAAATTTAGVKVAVHEILHTLGFADEYAYSNQKEANLYCDRVVRAPNLAVFMARSAYFSDEEARGLHASNMMWYSRVNASAISAPPALGTPEPNRIGLYPAKTCSQATTGYSSWHPGGSSNPNIMEKIDGDAEIPESFCPGIREAFGEPTTRSGRPSGPPEPRKSIR